MDQRAISPSYRAKVAIEIREPELVHRPCILSKRGVIESGFGSLLEGDNAEILLRDDVIIEDLSRV